MKLETRRKVVIYFPTKKRLPRTLCDISPYFICIWYSRVFECHDGAFFVVKEKNEKNGLVVRITKKNVLSPTA
jgi:hypothetical protein